MNKMVDGKIVEMTAEEVAERLAEEQKPRPAASKSLLNKLEDRVAELEAKVIPK